MASHFQNSAKFGINLISFYVAAHPNPCTHVNICTYFMYLRTAKFQGKEHPGIHEICDIVHIKIVFTN